MSSVNQKPIQNIVRKLILKYGLPNDVVGSVLVWEGSLVRIEFDGQNAGFKEVRYYYKPIMMEWKTATQGARQGTEEL